MGREDDEGGLVHQKTHIPTFPPPSLRGCVAHRPLHCKWRRSPSMARHEEKWRLTHATLDIRCVQHAALSTQRWPPVLHACLCALYPPVPLQPLLMLLSTRALDPRPQRGELPLPKRSAQPSSIDLHRLRYPASPRHWKNGPSALQAVFEKPPKTVPWGSSYQHARSEFLIEAVYPEMALVQASRQSGIPTRLPPRSLKRPPPPQRHIQKRLQLRPCFRAHAPRRRRPF